MPIYTPDNLDRALFLMKSCKARPIAGGNDIIPEDGANYVKLSGIPGLDIIKNDGVCLRVGAMTKLDELMECTAAPMVLRRAIASVAPIEVRRSATVGGSVAVLASKSVLPPVLSGLGASVAVRTRLIERIIPIDEFLEKGAASLPDGGMIFEIVIPLNEYTNATFEAIPSPFHPFHSFCGLAVVEEGMLHSLRIRFGGVSDAPIMSREAERILEGRSVAKVKAVLPHILDMYASLIEDSANDSHSRTLIGLLEEFIGRM